MQVLAMPDNNDTARPLARALRAAVHEVHVSRFPDGESLVRIEADLTGREVALVCTLHRPDEAFIALAFAAATARDLGASRVGLVAPYLSYMRQDRRFREGEGVSARYFARLLSDAFDWLVTVEPHLHRVHGLHELFTIPAQAVHAAPAIAAYVRAHHPDAVLIGPDEESEQWISAIARDTHLPYTVLHKERLGDLDVRVSVPDIRAIGERVPVVIDDIISTGQTLTEAARQLRAVGARPPVCIAVHAVLEDGVADALDRAGIAQLITCNTIMHPSNRIDLTPAVAAAVRSFAAPD
jgi:ribose-phosphate pyrophosphokinase